MTRKELTKSFIILSIILLNIISIYGFAIYLKANRVETYSKKTYNYSKLLDLYLKNSQILGTTRTLGLIDSQLKRIASGKLLPDDSNVLESLDLIRKQYDSSIVYVMDEKGTVVACTPYDGNQTLTGNNYAFRPYFMNALKGFDTVYPALGVTTKKRGLYYSSPIYDSEKEKIIGVFVVKQSFDNIDAFLDTIELPVVVASPGQIVFATNHREWLLRPLVPLADNKILTEGDTKQFENPIEYPAVGKYGKDESFKVGNEDFQSVIIPLPIEDKEGTWKLVFFVDKNKLFPPIPYAVGSGIMIFFYFVGIHLINVGDERKQSQLELEKQNLRLIENELYLRKVNQELVESHQLLQKMNESLDLKVKERTHELEKEKESLELKVQERTRDLEVERKSLEEKVKIRTQELEDAKSSLELKVQERTEELAKNVVRLEEANKSMIGREKRIIELKEQLRSYRKSS